MCYIVIRVMAHTEKNVLGTLSSILHVTWHTHTSNYAPKQASEGENLQVSEILTQFEKL